MIIENVYSKKVLCDAIEDLYMAKWFQFQKQFFKKGNNK